MRASLIGLMLLIAAAAAASEPPRYADAWSPETVAAAEAAVGRLGANRALGLAPTVLNLVGLQALGFGGSQSGLVANVQELRAAMNALGAQEIGLEIHVNFPAEVLFDFDKSDIRSDAAKALSQLALIIRAQPKGHTRLEGHTDSKGDDAYNQKLSERRAESVKKWLVEKEQIDPSRLVTKGWGESKPVAPNDTDANRQKNRRLEAIVEKG